MLGVGLFRALFTIYIAMVLVYTLRSWIRFKLPPEGEWLLKALVEPALQPFRAVLRPVTEKLGLDFSPAILIAILVALSNFL